MNRVERGGFVPEEEQSPLEIAQKQFGVDLNDNQAVLDKLTSLKGKLPDVADLSNLWQDYQERSERKKAQPIHPEQQAVDEVSFRLQVEKQIRPIVESRLSDLNDQLEAKGMKLIPIAVMDKVVEQLVQEATTEAKLRPTKLSTRPFEDYDIERWLNNLDQEEIDRAMQKAA